MRHGARQRGLTIWGFLFVAAVVVIFAVVGFRVAPAYIEYFAVQKALEQSLYETKDFTSTAEIRKAFQRRADTGYIESVGGQDVFVAKTGNEITASASWTRKLHLVANASVFLEFEATATR